MRKRDRKRKKYQSNWKKQNKQFFRSFKGRGVGMLRGGGGRDEEEEREKKIKYMAPIYEKLNNTENYVNII